MIQGKGYVSAAAINPSASTEEVGSSAAKPKAQLNGFFGDIGNSISNFVGGIVGSSSYGITPQTGVDAAKALDKQDAANRSNLYNDIIANTHLDDITRNELVDMMGNSTVDAVAAKMNDALAGKGIYAARMYNQSIAVAAADMPGRAQLTPSLAGRA